MSGLRFLIIVDNSYIVCPIGETAIRREQLSIKLNIHLEVSTQKVVKIKAHKRIVNGKTVKVRSHYRVIEG